jgi:hypothetical protein
MGRSQAHRAQPPNLDCRHERSIPRSSVSESTNIGSKCNVLAESIRLRIAIYRSRNAVDPFHHPLKTRLPKRDQDRDHTCCTPSRKGRRRRAVLQTLFLRVHRRDLPVTQKAARVRVSFASPLSNIIASRRFNKGSISVSEGALRHFRSHPCRVFPYGYGS